MTERYGCSPEVSSNRSTQVARWGPPLSVRARAMILFALGGRYGYVFDEWDCIDACYGI
jgi:hypothetical protein